MDALDNAVESGCKICIGLVQQRMTQIKGEVYRLIKKYEYSKTASLWDLDSASIVGSYSCHWLISHLMISLHWFVSHLLQEQMPAMLNPPLNITKTPPDIMLGELVTYSRDEVALWRMNARCLNLQ